MMRSKSGTVEVSPPAQDHEVGDDENHSLASLMDVLGVLIEKYEDEQVAELTE